MNLFSGRECRSRSGFFGCRFSKFAVSAAIVALTGSVAFGRGERWVPKPPAPPPVATLTNEARYIEWKWRCDVTDPSTGIDNAAATASLKQIAQRLEPTEEWNVVKATCFAFLCDHLAMAPLLPKLRG